MRKTIKNTFALAALLIAGATSTVSAQTTEKEGTIIQTEQVNGGLKKYTIQDETSGQTFKSLPLQAQFAMGEIVDYRLILTPNQSISIQHSNHISDGSDDVAVIIKKR